MQRVLGDLCEKVVWPRKCSQPADWELKLYSINADSNWCLYMFSVSWWYQIDLPYSYYSLHSAKRKLKTSCHCKYLILADISVHAYLIIYYFFLQSFSEEHLHVPWLWVCLRSFPKLISYLSFSFSCLLISFFHFFNHIFQNYMFL